jgi:hypothetical protein
MKVESSLYSNYSDSFRNKKLEQYKNDYLDLVGYYKKLNEDNDEIYFVDSEIRLINEYIRPVVESQKTELEQRGILDLTNHMIKISLSSYLKIISFLQSRKLELEKESSSPSQQLEPEISEQKRFSKPCFKINKFDHVNKDKVLGYFKAELVDKNYLSLETLNKYLIVAFQEKTTIAEKITLEGKFSQGIIRNIFYRYYSEIAQDKHGLKQDYCKLLGEYFVGFDTDKISRNFNK